MALARLLGPEQLGLASTLVVTGSFFDSISDTGGDRFLIQNRDGDTPEVQKLVQLVMAGRGLLVGLALLAAAGPVAIFFKEPRLVWALMGLALSPMISGFRHLDYRRIQRHMDFRSDALITTISEIVALAVTVVAALLTRSFTAVLFGLIARSAVSVLMSHIVAERPYRLGFAPKYARALLAFSGPLVVSGLFLYLGSQGDRVLIANRLGVTQLGYYSTVMLLIYYPSQMLVRFVHAMYLPLVAAARDDPAQERQVIDRLAGETLLLSVAMAAGFAVVAPPAVVILFGHRYIQSAFIVALIGVLQIFRYMIVWPSTVALGGGHSQAVLAINVVRVVAYPSAIVGGWLLGGLPGIVAGFIVGEAVALVTGLVMINRTVGSPFWTGFDRLALFGVICAFIITATLVEQAPIGIFAFGFSAMVLIAWTIRRERAVLAEAIGIVAGMLGFRPADPPG